MTPVVARARTLLVSPDGSRHGAPDDAEVVADLFDAMVEIATARIDAPVETVLVAGGAVPPAPFAGLEALRRLDPSVTIVGIGFEHPDLEGTLPEPDAAAPAPAPPSLEPEPEPEPEPAADDGVVEADGGDDRLLADGDLVEAVLAADGTLRAKALRIVRERTGWPRVRLVRELDVGCIASAVVSRDGAAFGHLVVDDADADHARLSAWAEWLARWFALDESHATHRELAYRDDLTGIWNRRYFNRFLDETILEARTRRRPVTVMVFDIDDFKTYNDRYGHDAGDEILRETVRLLQSVIRRDDRVCRIGGDEFVVVFADLDEPRERGSRHPDSVETIARRFQDQIRQAKFPRLGLEAPGSLSVSAGLASFPWDAHEPTELLRIADERALESKRRGKNLITFGLRPDA